jgi:myosin heavy subunit
MQIQYNITRIEEWCKSHDMPEGTLQLEHLMQATKLLQLKKVRDFLKGLTHVVLADWNFPGNGRRH